jgi:hypothetical protein
MVEEEVKGVAALKELLGSESVDLVFRCAVIIGICICVYVCVWGGV